MSIYWKNIVCDNNDNNVDKKILYNINIIVIFKYVHILKNTIRYDVETIYCHKEMLSLFYNCLSDLRTVLVSQWFSQWASQLFSQWASQLLSQWAS